jgi:hypothetical protein
MVPLWKEWGPSGTDFYSASVFISVHSCPLVVKNEKR